MERRRFLQLAAGMGGAMAMAPTLARLGGLSTLARATGTGSVLDGAAADCPIDTIVVLMMENRSIDHYLGWLATDESFLELGRSRYGADFAFDGVQRQSFVDAATGLPVETYDIVAHGGQENAYRGCGHSDPGHGWSAGRAQRNGGFLAAGSGNDEFALSYYNADSIPFYATMARSFTTFDRYHASLLGPTYPNREYMHSAQSGGIKSNNLPPQIGYPTGFDWPTIWDKLQAAGVSCGYYYVDLPAVALFGARLAPIARHVEHFFADAAAGTLPRVVFVDPGFTTGFRTDDHPYADIRAGQKYASNIFKAFYQGPQWETGAFFINYDEWGGFFDHVAPPVFADDRASAVDADNFGQAGFRVPCLMASPYAAPGWVDHRQYDHTSILRFIEWRYLGAPAELGGGSGWWLTERDRNALNIGAALRASKTGAGVDLELLPAVPVASAPCQGQELEGTGAPNRPVLPGEPTVGGEPTDAFEALLHSGYLESAGFKVDPRLPAEAIA
jgi:phospholipase C